MLIILSCAGEFICLYFHDDCLYHVLLYVCEITSNLLVPKNVLFTFSKEEGFGVKSLNELTGDIVWENNLTSSSEFLECGKFAYPDKESCLLMDNIGTMYLFDPSDGRKIWERKLNLSNFSLTVLPDCNKDGLDEIAVATSKSQIRILSMRNIQIKGCDSIPVHLMAWKKQNETDLIFICQEGENETLMKISQEEWCRSDKSEIAKMSTLTSEKVGILSQSKFLSITEGLILWKHDFVTMLKNDGHQLWSLPTSNHSTKNRFLMSGKFRTDKKEVFLYSSDISSNFQVTLLSAETGEMIETKTIPHLELTEAMLIHGEKSDFILGLKKKPCESLKSQISASVVNILTNKEVIPTRITEEITLMEMDGNDLKTILSQQLDYDKSELYASSFTVVLNNDVVRLFVTTQPQISHLAKSTAIKSITLSNWDTSTEKSSHCVWKYL
ncbi:uncharacterized protein [Parasteatoda tepidariorum]|uniref:uncharacterized protein isoform X2 n=1 Tax=Parasteatoda tepidariorum TaxID=114398 RepID=UPI00077FC863|nr:uncharacterized protein LOC107452999 isoform X2 [Parasteatoda tepidariorum]